ncbi:MAG: hypothetical protein KKD28_01455 [Chloroflexi bacterium]|nr:hypothetical protein [Chloroflexota bacterium]
MIIKFRWILLCLLLVVVVILYAAPIFAQPTSVGVPFSPIPEAKDFATLVLGDPWDMNEYSDISQYMNESGERDVVRNINFYNGIFSATSAGHVLGDEQQNGWFFTLFPGYETAIHTGRSGSKTPIVSSDYRCFYAAMKVDSPAANQFGPDQFRVFWFGDDRLNTGGAPYGFTTGIPLYPEYGASTPSPIWKLYKIDLLTTLSYEVPWDGQPAWQGFRIDPTINAGINYAVDWVRLTDCTPQTTEVYFTPDVGISSIWLRPQGTENYIRVATDVDGSAGFYELDIQGVQPGTYHVGFGDQFSCCVDESVEVLTINQTPIAAFHSPTFYSGEDFATMAGDAWDMNSPNDYSEIRCAQYDQEDGFLGIRTPPYILQPPECLGQDEQAVSDPSVFLNTPVLINPAEYRYFSFRMYDDNPWQLVPQGSMVRWVWTVQGDSGRPGYECDLVSHDVPFDVNWNTYTLDLWDAFQGSAEAWSGIAQDGSDECDTLPKNWWEGSPVLKARFDPNENITDHEFYNRIDWIRLTKEISIKQGTLFDLRIEVNKAINELVLNFYYTTDPKNDPTQHPLMIYYPPTPNPPPIANHSLFLPVVLRNYSSEELEGEKFIWDTFYVEPGTYYICVQADDGYNQAIYCSEATVKVYNP